MVNRKVVIWIVCAVILAVAAWVFLLPSEEKRVKRQFSRLCAEVGKAPNEGMLETALRLRRAEALFAPSCLVEIGEQWIDGATDAASLVAQGFQARMQFASMTLGFSDFKIAFPKDDQASCEVIAKLVGVATSGGNVDEAREMVWELRKLDGSWRFSAVRQVQVVRR